MPLPTVRAAQAFAWLICAPTLAGQATPSNPTDTEALRIARQYCAQCHLGPDAEADLDVLQVLGTQGLSTIASARFLDLRDVLESHDMPPEDEPQPNATERAKLLQFVRQRLQERRDRPNPRSDPGRVTMRRLSRAEYRNTVRDVLGLDAGGLVDGFPSDDLGYGFDNVGDALTVSTLHVEKYAHAAAVLAARAVPPRPHIERSRSGSHLEVSKRNRQRGDTAALITNGSASSRLRVPVAGRYRIRTEVYATQAGSELARMELHVDQRTIGSYEIRGTARAPETVACEVVLQPGEHEIAAVFVNDHYDPRHRDPRRRDRNLMIRRLQLAGPIGDRAPTRFEASLPAATWGDRSARARARAVVPELLLRLWRRPATSRELERMTRLITLVAERDDARTSDPRDPFRAGLRLALRAALASPHFAFRVETRRVATQRGDQPRDLTGYELATRLSYLLWSSAPDRELLALAKPLRRGARNAPLTRLATLHQQVQRMLEDPRARSLATNFAAQWLELRSLGEAKPDPDRFPEFDEELRRAMRREVELCVLHVIRERLPVVELVQGEWTYLNQRLAEHYGIDGVEGTAFRLESTAGTIRGGLLGHAALLTVTSHPVRTSPVRRGKWILENVLGTPPPPPPPMVDSFPENTATDSPQGLREAMRRHREQASCAVCHRKMDALGLALEAFDALGRHRPEVDSTGTLPDGTELGGPVDLRRVLGSSRSFVRCLTRKLFIFAVGRGPTEADELQIDALATELGAQPTFHDIIRGIVGLDSFRRRLDT